MAEAAGSAARPSLDSGFAPQPDPPAPGRRRRRHRPARSRCSVKPWPLSDKLLQAEREALAAGVLSPTATLDDAIRLHLLEKDRAVRRHIRVEMAHRFISGNGASGSSGQRDAFRTLIDSACIRLALSPADRADTRSAFFKAAAHRVEPLRHERLAVQRTAGLVI